MSVSAGHTEAGAVRMPHIALNVLGHCHSSACVELGKTRVICAVRPPQQLVQEYRGDAGRITCRVHRAPAGATAATVAGVYALQPSDSADRDFALAMEGVAEQVVQLERLAQLLVEVVFEVVSEDGGLWDAAATALSAALAVGGFDMNETFSACTAGVSEQGVLLTDLTAEQEASAANVVTVVCSLAAGNLLYVRQNGLCDVTTLESLVQQALQGVAARKECILQQLRDSVIKKGN